MEYEAAASVLLVNVATPELFKVPEPSLPKIASLKVTVCAGFVTVGAGFTVAVRVTLVPKFTGEAGEMLSVVVVETAELFQPVTKL